MKATTHTTETVANHQMRGQLNAEILQWISIKIAATKKENQLIKKLRSVVLVNTL